MPHIAQRLRRTLEDIDTQLRNAVDDWPLDDEALGRIAHLEVARTTVLRLLSEAEAEAEDERPRFRA